MWFGCNIGLLCGCLSRSALCGAWQCGLGVTLVSCVGVSLGLLCVEPGGVVWV